MHRTHTTHARPQGYANFSTREKVRNGSQMCVRARKHDHHNVVQRFVSQKPYSPDRVSTKWILHSAVASQQTRET